MNLISRNVSQNQHEFRIVEFCQVDSCSQIDLAGIVWQAQYRSIEFNLHSQIKSFIDVAQRVLVNRENTCTDYSLFLQPLSHNSSPTTTTRHSYSTSPHSQVSARSAKFVYTVHVLRANEFAFRDFLLSSFQSFPPT